MVKTFQKSADTIFVYRRMSINVNALGTFFCECECFMHSLKIFNIHIYSTLFKCFGSATYMRFCCAVEP